MKNILALLLVTTFLNSMSAQVDIDPLYRNHKPALESLYLDLHRSPELSHMEVKTAAKMAGALRQLGFEVTEKAGGNNVVGLLRNGEGPVIMVRTDMDALPVLEKTGIPYASTVVARDHAGTEMPVMHACGHDVHMTVWTGTARLMKELQKEWKGTLMMIAQQAEETGGGADAALEAGLFKKFPVPQFALAYHVSPSLPAGTVGYRPGPIFAGVSSVDITVYGKGGHGAVPDQAVDPVVLAARLVLDIQTIVSRELSPLEPAVITVGSIHGGTKHNIIPDEVKLQLTIRYFDEEVFDRIIQSLDRLGKGLAISAGLPSELYPKVEMPEGNTPPVLNNQRLVSIGVEALSRELGAQNVLEVGPLMVGEDFGKYGLTEEKVPIAMFWLGSVAISDIESGKDLPGLHSAYYHPDYPGTIQTGVKGMVAMLLELFKTPRE